MMAVGGTAGVLAIIVGGAPVGVGGPALSFEPCPCSTAVGLVPGGAVAVDVVCVIAGIVAVVVGMDGIGVGVASWPLCPCPAPTSTRRP